MLNPFDLMLDKLAAIERQLEGSHPAQQAPVEVIDRAELCKRLAITEPTVIRWEQRKKIPSFRIGSNVRYN